VLLVLPSGTLLAFAEGRNNTYCSGTNDGNNSTIVLKRSLDAGTSWGPLAFVYTRKGVDYLAAVYDVVTDTVHLMLQVNGTLAVWLTSPDRGISWSEPSTLDFPLGNFSSAVPSVAHGIQLSGGLCPDGSWGGTQGRLVIPFVCHGDGSGGGSMRGDGRRSGGARPITRERALRQQRPARAASLRASMACPGCYSCLLLSDDHGASWQLGAASTQEGTRESGVVQLRVSGSARSSAGANNSPKSLGAGTSTAALYVSERNMGATPGHRLHARSTDGGASFSAFGADSIPDADTGNWTGVVAGVTRFDPLPLRPLAGERAQGAAGRTIETQRGHGARGSPDSGSLILISTPASLTARQDLAIYVSADEATTWSAGTVISAGPAGYSDMGQLNGSAVGVLFENGPLEFAQQISFGLLQVASLRQIASPRQTT
jgi:hypothetical protein